MALFILVLTVGVLPTCWSEPQHWWPRARGDIGRYGSTSLPGPRNLTAQLQWKFLHPQLLISTGSLVDSDRNIYFSAVDGIAKFSPDGTAIWKSEQKLNNAIPVISGDALYGSSVTGWMYKIDLASGKEVWRRQHGGSSEMDANYVEVYKGVVLQAFDRLPEVQQPLLFGNRRVVAANASDGEKLWEYLSDTILWNFLPMFPGDDTFLVMDVHGGVLRLEVSTGQLVSYTAPPEPWMLRFTFTDGGLILSPDGRIAYTCSNLGLGDSAGSPGVLRAYDVGEVQLTLKWQRVLPEPCVSWPASDGQTVVVPVGALPLPIPSFAAKWIPGIVKWLLMIFFTNGGEILEQLWVKKPLLVLAFDATTGKPKWVYDKIEPWRREQARGDLDMLPLRLPVDPARPACGPASWSSVTISGDGTVYAAAMNGVLYAMRDANADGIVESDEVSTLDVGAASLHQGASFAEGMMTFTTCSGIWVFNT